MNKFLTAMVVAATVLASRFADGQTPVDLNVMEPLTGSGAFLGQGQKAALQSLAASVNQSGGIDGRPVNLIFHDDQTNPQTAVQLLNEVLATHPPVVLGSALVAMCNAMAPIMRDGPLLYCLSPGHSPVPGTYDLASGAPVDDTVQALFRFFRLKGWTKLALITSSDASGQEADRAIGAVLALPENKSLELVQHVHFNPTDISCCGTGRARQRSPPPGLHRLDHRHADRDRLQSDRADRARRAGRHDRRKLRLFPDEAVRRIRAERALSLRLGFHAA